MLSPHELGLYSEALFLTQIFVSRFIPPLNDVAFPAYARMQADKSMLNQSFCKAVRLILLVACPLYLGMAVVAEPFIQILFGSKWLGMAPRSEEHTSELQSIMRRSYAVFCLNKKTYTSNITLITMRNNTTIN